MDKKSVSWTLIIIGAIAYLFPQWQGVLIDSGAVSIGEARIVATIMIMGGILLFYLPNKN